MAFKGASAGHRSAAIQDRGSGVIRHGDRTPEE